MRIWWREVLDAQLSALGRKGRTPIAVVLMGVERPGMNDTRLDLEAIFDPPPFGNIRRHIGSRLQKNLRELVREWAPEQLLATLRIGNDGLPRIPGCAQLIDDCAGKSKGFSRIDDTGGILPPRIEGDCRMAPDRIPTEGACVCDQSITPSLRSMNSMPGMPPPSLLLNEWERSARKPMLLQPLRYGKATLKRAEAVIGADDKMCCRADQR